MNNRIDIISVKQNLGYSAAIYTLDDIVADGHAMKVRVKLPSNVKYGDVVSVKHDAWWIEPIAGGAQSGNQYPAMYASVGYPELEQGYVNVVVDMRRSNALGGLDGSFQANTDTATMVLAGDHSGVVTVEATIRRFRESLNYGEDIEAVFGMSVQNGSLSQYIIDSLDQELMGGMSYGDVAVTTGLIENGRALNFWGGEVLHTASITFACSASYSANVVSDGVTNGLCHITYVRGVGQRYAPSGGYGSPNKWITQKSEYGKFVVQLNEPLIKSTYIARCMKQTEIQYGSVSQQALDMEVSLTVNKVSNGSVVGTRTVSCILGMIDGSILSGYAVLDSQRLVNDEQIPSTDLQWFTGDQTVVYSFTVNNQANVLGTQVNLQFTDMSYPGVVSGTNYYGFLDVPNTVPSFGDAAYNINSIFGYKRALTATLVGDVYSYGMNKFAVMDDAETVAIRVNCQSLGPEFIDSKICTSQQYMDTMSIVDVSGKTKSAVYIQERSAFHTVYTGYEDFSVNDPMKPNYGRMAVFPLYQFVDSISKTISETDIQNGFFEIVANKNGTNALLFDALVNGISVDHLLSSLTLTLSNSYNQWIDSPPVNIQNGRTVLATKIALVSILAWQMNVVYEPVVGDAGIETFEETSTSLSTAPVIPKPKVSIDSNRKKITVDYSEPFRFITETLPSTANTLPKLAGVEQAIRLIGRSSQLWAPTPFTPDGMEVVSGGMITASGMSGIAMPASDLQFLPGLLFTENYKSGVYPASNSTVFPLNIEVNGGGTLIPGWGYTEVYSGGSGEQNAKSSDYQNAYLDGFYFRHYADISADKTTNILRYFAAKYTQYTVEFDYTEGSSSEPLVVELSELLHQQFMPSRVGDITDTKCDILMNAKASEVQWGGFFYKQPIQSKHVKAILQDTPPGTISFAKTIGGAELLVQENTSDAIGTSYEINNPFHATVFLKPAFNVKLVATTSAEPNGVVYIQPGSSATVKKTAINTYEVLVSGSSSSADSSGVDISAAVQGVVADIASITANVNNVVSSSASTSAAVNGQTNTLNSVATLLNTTKTSVDGVAAQLATDASTLGAITGAFNTVNTNIYNTTTELSNLNYSVNITNTNLTTVANALTSIGNSIGGIVASTIPSGTVRWVAGNFSDPAWEDLRIQPPTTVNPTTVAVYGMPVNGGTLTRTSASVYRTIPVGDNRIIFAPTEIPSAAVNPCEMDYSSGVAITSYPNTGNPIAANISYVVAGDYLYRIGGAGGSASTIAMTSLMAKTQISVSGATNTSARTWTTMTSPTRIHSGGAHVVLGTADTHCILVGGASTGTLSGVGINVTLLQATHTSAWNTNYITAYNLSTGVSVSLPNLPVYLTGSLFIRTGSLTVMGVAFGATCYYDPAVTFGTNQILVYTLTMASDMTSYTFNWKYVPTAVATYSSINGNAITTTGPAELEIVKSNLKLWFSKAGSTSQINCVSIPLDFVSNASAACTASVETVASVLYRETLSNLANNIKSEQFYPSYIGHSAIFISSSDTSASGGTIYALNSMPSSMVNGTPLTTKFVIKK